MKMTALKEKMDPSQLKNSPGQLEYTNIIVWTLVGTQFDAK